MTTSRIIPGLLGWLSLIVLAAAVGGYASASVGTFYRQLVRPGWAPPGWLFTPVWIVLHLMMGAAAFLVWKQRGFRTAGGALSLFVMQLTANALWTWLFFAWQRGALTFLEILVLWTLIPGTTIAFWRIKHWQASCCCPTSPGSRLPWH